MSKLFTDALVEALFPSVRMEDPLERVLVIDDLNWDLSSVEEEILMFLEAQSAAKPMRNQRFEELEKSSGSKPKPFIEEHLCSGLPSNLKYVFLESPPPHPFFTSCYCYRFVGKRRGETFEGLAGSSMKKRVMTLKFAPIGFIWRKAKNLSGCLRGGSTLG